MEKGEIEKQIAEIQTKLDAAWADDDEDAIDKFDEMIVGMNATREELAKQLEEEFPWVEERIEEVEVSKEWSCCGREVFVF